MILPYQNLQLFTVVREFPMKKIEIYPPPPVPYLPHWIEFLVAIKSHEITILPGKILTCKSHEIINLPIEIAL